MALDIDGVLELIRGSVAENLQSSEEADTHESSLYYLGRAEALSELEVDIQYRLSEED